MITENFLSRPHSFADVIILRHLYFQFPPPSLLLDSFFHFRYYFSLRQQSSDYVTNTTNCSPCAKYKKEVAINTALLTIACKKQRPSNVTLWLLFIFKTFNKCIFPVNRLLFELLVRSTKREHELFSCVNFNIFFSCVCVSVLCVYGEEI